MFAMVTLALVVAYRADGSDESSETADGAEAALLVTEDGDGDGDGLRSGWTSGARSAIGIGTVDEDDSPSTTAPVTTGAETAAAPSTAMTQPPSSAAPVTAPPLTKAPTTAAPTTRPPTTRPPTTAAPTTAAPTTPAPAETSPTTPVDPAATDPAAPVDPSQTTVVDPAATDTTAPPETAPPATAHPEGWVDAGHGVLIPPVLLAIRYCESRDNYTAANPNSTARGAYQFLTSSWKSYGHADRYGVARADLATPAQQDEAALLTWQRSGTSPWNASKSCWT